MVSFQITGIRFCKFFAGNTSLDNIKWLDDHGFLIIEFVTDKQQNTGLTVSRELKCYDQGLLYLVSVIFGRNTM